MERIQNYKMILAYDGSRYYGWEHQPDRVTIQGKLEDVLNHLSDKPVEILGAGRTDAGVHAKGMVANFRLATAMTEDDLRDYMNKYLPDDICVVELRRASERFHARYNALGKTYCYTCYYGNGKPIFNRKYVNILDAQPDLEKMREAAEILTGTHDFASFCSNSRMKKSTVRKVDQIEITQKRNYINFTYHGTGFLQHMVRIMTGTLLEVGFGKRSPENMYELLEERRRALAGATAPAKGLCLIKVDYD